MKKNNKLSLRTIIIMIIVGLAIVLFGIISILNSRVTLPPDDATGNTAGNLHNGGLFFEMDGVVYFSNVTDSGCLYSMSPDETNFKKLTTMHVNSINGYGKYLYFYMDSTAGSVDSGLGAAINQFGMYRSKLDGSNQVNLVRDLVGSIQLIGPYLYYQIEGANYNGSLNKIRIDREDETIVKEEKIDPSCVYNGIIYYTGVQTDHYLHSLNTNVLDTTTVVLNGTFFNPIVEYPYLYYMNESYNICRVSMLTNESEVLTEDRVDFFNMNDEYIFYSVSASDSPCVKRMTINGQNPTVVAEGIFNSIHLTSQYVYFKPYGADNVMYHMPISGGIYSTFRPETKAK